MVLFLAARLAEIGGRIFDLAVAEGYQAPLGRRAGKDHPGAVWNHSHLAKLPEFLAAFASLMAGFLLFLPMPMTPPHVIRWHWGFDDPAKATGTEEERLAMFRRVRDEIEKRIKRFRDTGA